MDPLLGFGLLAVGVAATFSPEVRASAADLLAGISGRGARVGQRTQTDGAGIVPDDPQGLADAAGLSLDVYALARMISSEEGPSALPRKLAVGWVARNHASSSGVAELLLRGKGDAAGHFAEQSAGGKWASTGRDPYEDDVQIAQVVLAGNASDDPTNGAEKFYNPTLQDTLAARGSAGYTKDAAAVDAAWRAEGYEPVAVDGIDPSTLTFYRRA